MTHTVLRGCTPTLFFFLGLFSLGGARYVGAPLPNKLGYVDAPLPKKLGFWQKLTPVTILETLVGINLFEISVYREGFGGSKGGLNCVTG